MRKIADLFFLIRPPLLCASFTFFFAGAASAVRHAGSGGHPGLLLAETLPGLLLFALIVSAAFVVNQIFDVESDRLNRKAFLLASGVVSRREALAVLIGLGAAAVGLSLAFDSGVKCLTIFGLALGLAYSVPPLRLKGRPVLDLVANVAGFGVIGFALGWLTYAGMTRELWLRCSPYALAMSGIFLNTCIPDEMGDRQSGDRTSCVVFGRRAVGTMILAFMVSSAVLGVLTGEMLCTLAVFGSLPAIIAVGVEPTSSGSVVASQYAARLLLVLVCFRAPLLALLCVAAYAGSRLYYRKRFGLRYPNLSGAVEIGPGAGSPR
jgi:4-hydroxybenzoate polyprenyltransferase